MGLKTSLENKAIESLNNLNLPTSLLIIPDGNGRWAKDMNVTVYEGHKKGANVFIQILTNFLKLNIKVLGAWGFSEDNWKRPAEEIDKIMIVIEDAIKDTMELMQSNNMKLLVLGNKDKIKINYPSLFQTIEEGLAKTAANTGKILALFIDYGERYMLEEFAKARILNPNLSTYELLSKINEGLPLIDMVMRTSGELRMSGFGPLASLAEFVSVKKNLPELTDKDMAEALIEFSKRQRRLGARPS